MDMVRDVFVLALLLVLLLCNDCTGKRVSGHIKTKETWAYITRFCFLSSGRGEMFFKYRYPKSYEPQKILLYFDTADQWPAVYKTNTNCSQKVSMFDPTNNQVIKLTENQRWSGCEDIGVDIVCSGGRIFRSSRERWWYLAVSNCGNPQGIDLMFEMNLTNSDESDHYFHHFSADEFYILQTDIAFVVIYIIVFAISVYVARLLSNRQLFHTTFKMFMVSVSTELAEVIFHCIGYNEYAYHGDDSVLSDLKLTGNIFGSCSILVFLLMLILMGKGYTITRGRLSQSGSIKIAIFMTAYVVVYVTLFIYQANFFDPGLVIYLYESPAGYGLIGLRLIGWLWFCYAIFFTIKHYPEKGKFYYPFLIVYSIWFVAMPCLVLAGHFVIPKYMREKVINGLELSLAFLGHSIFLFLTRPSAANSNFPYHVRTTQIGIVTPPSESGSDTSQSSATAMADYPSTSPDFEDETGMEKNFSGIFTTEKGMNNYANGKVNEYQFPHINGSRNSNRFA